MELQLQFSLLASITVPVFVSGITSYLMLTGIGLLGAIQARAKQNQGKQEYPATTGTTIEEPLTPYRRKEGRANPNEL